MTNNIKYPIAFDSKGAIVRYDDPDIQVRRSGRTCCGCGKPMHYVDEFTRYDDAIISSHFRHSHKNPNCTIDNTIKTVESIYHADFKKLLFDKIKHYIDNSFPFFMELKCNICGGIYNHKLLKDNIRVEIEYHEGDYRPDIALIDINNKIYASLEIIVTHNPEPDYLNFLKINNIYLLEFELDFEKPFDYWINKYIGDDGILRPSSISFVDNFCEQKYNESRYRADFKKFLCEKIEQNIANKSSLTVEIECDKCGSILNRNLLRDNIHLELEYQIEDNIFDIALIDVNNNKLYTVLEIFTPHRSEESDYLFLKNNNIYLLKFELSAERSFDYWINKYIGDDGILHPSSTSFIDFCDKICNICDNHLQKGVMRIFGRHCWRCKEIFLHSIIYYDDEESGDYTWIGPEEFTLDEIKLARSKGVIIEWRYSRTVNDYYYAMVCPFCNNISGQFFLYDDLAVESMDQFSETGGPCPPAEGYDHEDFSIIICPNHCIHGKCPNCGKSLTTRTNRDTGNPFTGCSGFPECRYTEPIRIDNAGYQSDQSMYSPNSLDIKYIDKFVDYSDPKKILEKQAKKSSNNFMKSTEEPVQEQKAKPKIDKRQASIEDAWLD